MLSFGSVVHTTIKRFMNQLKKGAILPFDFFPVWRAMATHPSTYGVRVSLFAFFFSRPSFGIRWPLAPVRFWKKRQRKEQHDALSFFFFFFSHLRRKGSRAIGQP